MVHFGEDVVLHTTKTAKTHALSHFTGPWSIFYLLGHTSEKHLSESWGFFPLWFLVFHSAESAACVISHAEPITVQSCPCWCACLSHLWLDNEHSECGGKQQGLWRMLLQYLCSLHISSLSCRLMQKVKLLDLHRAFSLNRNWHRLSISACSCLYVRLYTVQMQTLRRSCGLDDPTVIKQICKCLLSQTGKYCIAIEHPK